MNMNNLPKRIVEVLYPNDDIREYATSYGLEEVERYQLRTNPDNCAESMKPLVKELHAMPWIDKMSLRRDNITVEITNAYTWDEVRDVIIETINRHIFAGEAEVTVKDTRFRFVDSN